MAYISPEQTEKAKQMDALTYLMNYEPFELVKISANNYCTRTHDSLKLSNGKWYWWSRGIGGKSAVDYLIAVKDMSFHEAVKIICDCASIPYRVTAPKERKPVEKHLILPKKNTDDMVSRVFDVPELKLLIDTVKSSKFLTQKKTDELVSKLNALTSQPVAESLKRNLYSEGMLL